MLCFANVTWRWVCDGFLAFSTGAPRDWLRLPGHFWESGGHRVNFNSDLKPGSAFLIAIWSPINRSMTDRCPVGHHTHRADVVHVLGRSMIEWRYAPLVILSHLPSPMNLAFFPRFCSLFMMPCRFFLASRTALGRCIPTPWFRFLSCVLQSRPFLLSFHVHYSSKFIDEASLLNLPAHNCFTKC